ncbi:IS3 family transposase [Sphingomonas sp. SAFR-052]|uniref:IS3 family transposase n=1 Tax=Sphingomonas sp. SAFR-052 TaxID=3436867 RepID=UPI003F7E3015
MVRERGVSVSQAARDLDLHENVLRKWVREQAADPGSAFPGYGVMKPESQEIERLRRELARMKAERDILKKSGGLLRQGLDMRFEFIAKHRGIWPVSWICEALGVSRSGFHAWLVRVPSARARSDEEFGARVRASFISSYRTYGARRVWHDLLAEGLSCGLHRVERLMRVHGLRARPRRRGLPKDDGLRSVIADNLLDRQFTAEAPNQRWIADFTYIWTAEGWLYVAVVIDLFSRRIVGWSMSDTMAAQLVTDALMMAIWRRGKPDALLHHSDQGSQYTSEKFQRLMADNGVTCSMSRSGNVWDNAAMESFFSSLKTERVGRKTYHTRNHAKADAFDYIECFYNPTRRHSTLGYLSPIDFERQTQVA